MSGSLVPNSFSSYFLSDDDALEGSILSSVQKKVIQNRLAIRAEQKINLKIDATDPLSSLQEEAALAGEILAYRTILEDSVTSDEIKNPPNPAEDNNQ
jgi:hypothetical protein